VPMVIVGVHVLIPVAIGVRVRIRSHRISPLLCRG
jgi:hypothetical protein